MLIIIILAYIATILLAYYLGRKGWIADELEWERGSRVFIMILSSLGPVACFAFLMVLLSISIDNDKPVKW